MHAAWLLFMHLSHFPLPPHPQETSFGSFNAQITDPRRSGKSGGHLTQNDLQMSNSSCTFSVTTLNAQGSAEGRGAVLSRGWFRRLRFSIIEYFLSLLFFFCRCPCLCWNSYCGLNDTAESEWNGKKDKVRGVALHWNDFGLLQKPLVYFNDF